MNTINKKDIDFSKLKSRDNLSLGMNPSKFYIDEENSKLYKMFSVKDKEELKLKEKRLLAFDKVDNDSLSKPIDLIYDGDLVGYTQDIITGETLYSSISKKGLLQNMKTVLEASKNLEDLHKKDVIVSYMHFINIMVDQDKKPHYISIDNYQIDGLKSKGTTIMLNNYFAQKGKNVEKNVNTDIISFYLSLFDKLFNKDIYCVTPESYNSYLGTNDFLSEIYPIFFELSKRSGNIPEVPYLHKVLKNYDFK